MQDTKAQQACDLDHAGISLPGEHWSVKRSCILPSGLLPYSVCPFLKFWGIPLGLVFGQIVRMNVLTCTRTVSLVVSQPGQDPFLAGVVQLHACRVQWLWQYPRPLPPVYQLLHVERVCAVVRLECCECYLLLTWVACQDSTPQHT